MEVEIEVEGEDGSKLPFGENEKAVFGRGCGFDTHDRTVSRRHVSFQLQHSDSDVGNGNGNGNARVSFEVIGKNPFWVYDGESLRLFRKLEKGHLQVGHRFCFSPSSPLWFTLNHFQPQPLDHIHLSEIDPVKEFGFLVMGHEFDHYPKGMIQHTKNWEWFLEEPRKDSDQEEDFQKERRKMKGKRKMGRVNEDDDDEWTGESEDDKDLVATTRKGKLPRYSTRSKVNKGGNKDTKASQNSKQKRAASVDETVEEDDETLGGFIVADEDNDKQEEEDDDDEEEFEDDDDDDESDD